MAIATSYGAFIAGEWVLRRGRRGDRGAGAVRRRARRHRDAGLGGAGRRGRGGREGGVPGLAQHAAAHPRRDLPARVRPLHGAQRGDRRDDRPRGRQDHPRGARGDGGVHRRPLPAGLRGRAPLRTAACRPPRRRRTGTKRIMVVQEPIGVVAAVSPWNFPVDIAGIPLVYGLALGCTTVWKPSEYAPHLRQHVRAAAARRRLPAGHRQPRARPRRDRARSSSSTPTSAPSCSPARSRRARRSRATPASRTACSSWAATARRSCSPTPTSTRPPTRRSWAASTSPASAARRPSGSSSTRR